MYVRNVNIVPALGFGDFLRGSLSLYSICKERKCKFAIDYSLHPISTFLDNKHAVFENKSNSSPILICDNELPKLMDILSTESNSIDFTTNVWNFISPISSECRLFFQESIVPKPLLQEKIKYYKSSLQLNNNYVTVHIRTGDDTLIRGQQYSNFDNIYQKIKNHNIQSSIFLISDNIALKQFLKEKEPDKFICILDPIAHLALQTTNLDHVETTLIEFFIMASCSAIYQSTVYSWPSGFSRWCAEIYNIPFFSI